MLGPGDFSTTLEMTVYIMSFRAERSAVEKSPGFAKNSSDNASINIKSLTQEFSTCNQSKNANVCDERATFAFLAWNCKGQSALCRGVGQRPTWGVRGE